MHAAADRLEFAPPPTPGLARALLLAIVAHALLMVALTAGLSWQREAELVSAEAELWSAVPTEAAPRLVEPPPPAPTPPARAVEPPEPRLTDADIAIERERLRRQQDKERALKLKELQQQKLAQLELEKKREQEKRNKEKKLADDKRRAEQDAKRKETVAAQEKAKQLEAQRQENIKRLTGLANATGSSSATGSNLRSVGPSSSYTGRIVARIKSNMAFADSSATNLSVTILVRATAGGAIVSRKVIAPSPNKAWDEAVLKAIDKMDVLPRDVDGKIPEVIVREGLELIVSL